MTQVNVFDIKAKLSEYLDRAAQGERIVICRHNKPVAELRAIENRVAEPRPIGPLPGRPQFDVPAAFFEPLPDDILEAWEGAGTDADPLLPDQRPESPRSTGTKAAESKARYGSGRKTRQPRR